MKTNTYEKDNLENLCLFRLQMEKRALRGRINYESICFNCRGYDFYCEIYTPIKFQRYLLELLKEEEK